MFVYYSGYYGTYYLPTVQIYQVTNNSQSLDISNVYGNWECVMKLISVGI